MKLTKKIGIVLSGVIAMSATIAHAGNYSNLSPDDQNTINNGDQVTATQDVDGSAWPSITVYQRFAATPDQLAAVMFDYALHKSMFEGITESTPKTPGAAASDIDYTMTFPKVLGISLPDEHYTVRDVLSAFGAGGYRIDWTFVKASSMKDCSGSVQFEKLGTGTLVAYTNFINPPRPSLAKLITKMAVSRVQDTVKALGAQTIAESTGDATQQAQLNAQLSALSHALGH